VEYDAVMNAGLVDLQSHSPISLSPPAPPDIILELDARIQVEVRIPEDGEVGQGNVVCLHCDGTVDVHYTDEDVTEDHIPREYLTVVGGAALPPPPSLALPPQVSPPFCITLPPNTPPGSIIVAVSPEGCLMNVVVPPDLVNTSQLLLVHPQTESSGIRATGYSGYQSDDEPPPPSYESLYVMIYDPLPASEARQVTDELEKEVLDAHAPLIMER
jgi:hypothetical protein